MKNNKRIVLISLQAWRWLLFGMVLSITAGMSSCGGKASESANGKGTDSNTHWLSRCVEDTECGGELSCLCGVCTETCQNEATCDELSEAALCLPAACLEDDVAHAVAVCTKACDEDTSCSAGSRCDHGACVPNQAYEPCAGSSCGDQCTLCDPDSDQSCVESLEPKSCGPDGRCGDPVEQCAADERDAGDPEDPFTELPEDCAELAVPRADPECREPERCEQMRIDGSERVIRCSLSSSAPEGASEVERLSDCAARWLTGLGADEVRADDAEVWALANWEQFAPLINSQLLTCSATCEDGTCGCTELNEAECSADAFCELGLGRPVDPQQACLLPERFATCRAAYTLCSDAETFAHDSDGQCWHFSSICYDPAFTYDIEEDPTCSGELPECSQ